MLYSQVYLHIPETCVPDCKCHCKRLFITGLLACSSVTKQTVNRISACEKCRYYKHRRPRLCRYGCLCFDPTTITYRGSSRASHYILQQLPTSHITLEKAGSESKRYLLKALKKTASLRGSILKDAFRLRRFAVGCPHSIHSFNRFELKSAPGCQPSSSAPTLLRALLPCLRHHVLRVPLVDLLHAAAPACPRDCSYASAACMQQFQGIFYCTFAKYCSGHRRPQRPKLICGCTILWVPGGACTS